MVCSPCKAWFLCCRPFSGAVATELPGLGLQCTGSPSQRSWHFPAGSAGSAGSVGSTVLDGGLSAQRQQHQADGLLGQDLTPGRDRGAASAYVGLPLPGGASGQGTSGTEGVDVRKFEKCVD